MPTNVYSTDNGLTYLLHDLSPDGGTYPTTLFCKLLAVTRETKVTLSNRINLKSRPKVILECDTNPLTVRLERVKVYVTDTQNTDRCQL